MPQPPQPSFLAASLLVALGGAIGSWLRFMVARGWTAAIGRARADAFPWGTLTVNVVGSVAMGLIVGWLARSGTVQGAASEATRLLMAVGVIGGFTTFSSFSLEIVSILQRGQPGTAMLYLAASLAAGLAGLWLGLVSMRVAV